MSEVRRWPQCAECSRKFRGWWPVEEYHVETVKEGALALHRARVIVHATCSHGGHDGPGRQPFHQAAKIDVPIWWGDAHVRDAIAALKFFAQGAGAPDHGLVTDIT